MQKPIYFEHLALKIPLRAVMKPREAYFGIGAPQAIPATLAGFRSEIERADPNNEILSSRTRRRAAAVHMFRYNDINANSIAVISSLGPGVTGQGSIHKAELDKLRAEFRNKIMGNYDGGVKNWLYRWVEGEVGEYNWEMHMKNLRLRRAILLMPSQRDTDDEKRQKKEEAAMLEAAYLWHKDRLEKTFRAAMAQAKALQENGIIPPNGELWNLDELRTRWQYFASFDPYKPAEDEQRTEKPNHGPSAFYHQLTPANKSSFWAQRWSKNVAASLYEPYSVYVDLEANYDGQMGAQMRYTFLTICDATVDRVVAFRREQGQIKAAGFADRLTLDKGDWFQRTEPFKAFRNTKHPEVNGKGIEIVLVVPGTSVGKQVTPKKRPQVPYKHLPPM